jgi:TRAP-type mannitol/chloroaromatic compound transport system permease large subunit
MNAPVAVAIAVSSMLAILRTGTRATRWRAHGQRHRQLPAAAIPFFVFSGYLMGRGGLARRLIDFAALFGGPPARGLGYVNTLTACCSVRSPVRRRGGVLHRGFMIPEMNRRATTATSTWR